MLELTESAAAALDSLRRNEGIPESHGTRLTGGLRPEGNLEVRLEFVETPDEADQITEQSGTEMYIDPEVAEPLSSAVMDVSRGDEGLSFVFRPKEI
jgi:Fe-S cluster assembly iron-binding protein IscA